MPITFAFHVDKVLNDVHLPRDISGDEERGLLFYELVVEEPSCVSHNVGNVILSVPFHPDTSPSTLNVILYSEEEEVSLSYAKHTMCPLIGRFHVGGGDAPLRVFLHKYFQIDDETVSIEHHAEEGTSRTQKVPIASFSRGDYDSPSVSKADRIPSCIDDVVRYRFGPPRKELKKVRISIFPRQDWLTQSEFYSTSHVTSSSIANRDNVEIAVCYFLRKISDAEASRLSLFQLLTRFAALMFNSPKRKIRYREDRDFATNMAGDAGDALIEATRTGDCEDMAHFLMRTYRLLAHIYKPVLRDRRKGALFKKLETFTNRYAPYVYICRIAVKDADSEMEHLEYHATTLIVPVDKRSDVVRESGEELEALDVLSIEVTDPEHASYSVPANSGGEKLSALAESPQSDFFKWHRDSYFLVDNFFLHAVNRHVTLGNLVVGKNMMFTNY